MKLRAAIAGVLVSFTLVACGEPPTRPLAADESPSPEPLPSPSLFQGTLLGVRIDLDWVIKATPEPEPTCKRVGDDTGGHGIYYKGKTDLDFDPPDPKNFHVFDMIGPNKVACEGGFGLLVSYSLALRERGTTIGIARKRLQRMELILHAPRERFRTGTISGLPAIFMDQGSDPLDQAAVVVIEDDELDPYGQLLIIQADGGVPAETLADMAEQVLG